MKKKILFVAPFFSSFIRADIQALKEHYDVTVLSGNWKSKVKTPILLIQQFVVLLFSLKKYSAVLVSFAGYWSFIPALLGKWFGVDVHIIVHGTDAADFPEIHYGSLRKPLLRKAIYYSYSLATTLAPVSEALIYASNDYNKDHSRPQGIKAHFPDLQTKIVVIHNGLHVDKWGKLNTVDKEEKSFVTVFSEGQEAVKGIDLILEAAHLLPEYRFYLIGVHAIQGYQVPENIQYLGRMTSSELQQWYSSAQFYLQLSNFEGFGMALCEAMLCECIPIVSNINILPKIAGEAGIVLNRRSVEEFVNLLEMTVQIPDKEERGSMARRHILNRFPIEKRTQKLCELIEGLL